ncbi:hypothetical protein JW960_05650 [candidate division KSB1 bacterium]|nr:hypothetical protein [candidate division KSB1 bacterium]
MKFWLRVIAIVLVINCACFAGDPASEIQATVVKMQQRFLRKRGYTTLAIKHFKVLGFQQQQFEIAQLVTRKLHAALAELGYCEVLDVDMFNASIKNMLEKQVVHSKDYLAVARDLGANAILDGVVFDNGVVHIFINDAKTGKQLFADNIVFSESGKSIGAAVLRSVLVPGWGQMYLNQPRKGFTLMTAEVGLTTTALVMAILNNRAMNQFNRAQSVAEQERFADSITRTHQIHYVSLCAALALWIYGVIDANASIPADLPTIQKIPAEKKPIDIADKDLDLMFRVQYQFAIR